VGKVVYMMSMSLDGLIEGADRSIDWHLVDDELHQHMNEVLGAMGAFLHGRVVYDLMAAYWPTADSDPTAAPAEVAFAGIWREKPKVLYSRTADATEWNTTVVRDVVPEEVRRLAAQTAGDLALGGSDIGREFLRLGLVDEIRCYVHPVVVGRGKPMFQPSDTRFGLQLTETRVFGNGVVLLRYAVAS
jgi:dihydrofolate reductase